MSQKRKRVAAALMARMAAMAGPVPERGVEVGAAVVIFSSDFASSRVAS